MAKNSASAKHTNNLLGSLPHAQFSLLSPYMVVEQLEQGTILIEAGDETENVYFPHVGMLSLLSVLKDGRAIETATVGREGVVGAMAGLGAHISLVRVVVQLRAEVTRIPASRFRKATGESTTLRNLCVGYNEILLSQARINVACNAAPRVTSNSSGCGQSNSSTREAGQGTVSLSLFPGQELQRLL
ncbi:Crp/Fnr family transcriptional regulator [Bradyrhizobium barranii]